MADQPEALRLADALEYPFAAPSVKEANAAAAELRRLAVVEAERDALLEALKSTGLFLHHCWCDVPMNEHSFEKLNQQMQIVDAAIAQVKGGSNG